MLLFFIISGSCPTQDPDLSVILDPRLFTICNDEMSMIKTFLARLMKSTNPRSFPSRPPRVRVTTLHRILFQRLRDSLRDPLELANISTQGIGLMRRNVGAIQTGQKITGELMINENGYPIELEVRHLSEHVVGCQFIGSTPVLTKAIEEYFRIEILALRLNRVDEAYLKQDPNGRVSWFTDGGQNEVHFVSDEQGVLNFHMSFLGNYIEGGRGRPLRCGHIVEDTRIYHKGSALLDLSEPVTDEILELGKLLIDNVENLALDQAVAIKVLLRRTVR